MNMHVVCVRPLMFMFLSSFAREYPSQIQEKVTEGLQVTEYSWDHVHNQCIRGVTEGVTESSQALWHDCSRLSWKEKGFEITRPELQS